jgi:hypothetical protein
VRITGVNACQRGYFSGTRRPHRAR